MKNLLNAVGLYTAKQYNLLLKEKEQLEGKVSDYNKLIFNFDELLKNYGSQALNALFYKMVNNCRNSPDKKYLLPRWIERLTSAQTSLVTG